MTTTATATRPSVLESLLRLPAGDPEAAWLAFSRDRWPELFRLLAVAADLPRLGANESVAAMPDELWPGLKEAVADLERLQRLVDLPVVPSGTRAAPCRGPQELEAARAELEAAHCVTVDFFFDLAQRALLDGLVDDLAKTRRGTWGELERSAAPELFALVEEGLGSERFRHLTGFDLGCDAYTLTLSLQDLEPTGIGWHRDLYWPKEWVGEDVFAVLYGLGDDSPEKGGAFLYYVPWANEILSCYRKRHQATILWNAREAEGRILHAVSGYRTADTSRHLLILQCLRRA